MSDNPLRSTVFLSPSQMRRPRQNSLLLVIKPPGDRPYLNPDFSDSGTKLITRISFWRLWEGRMYSKRDPELIVNRVPSLLADYFWSVKNVPWLHSLTHSLIAPGVWLLKVDWVIGFRGLCLLLPCPFLPSFHPAPPLLCGLGFSRTSCILSNHIKFLSCLGSVSKIGANWVRFPPLRWMVDPVRNSTSASCVSWWWAFLLHCSPPGRTPTKALTPSDQRWAGRKWDLCWSYH